MTNPDKLTVHHSGQDSTIVELLSFFKTKDTSDFIPYHAIIDKEGNIYWGVNFHEAGEHVRDNNTGNIGICLLGDYSKKRPPIGQVSTLYDLLEFIILRYGITNIKPHNAYNTPEHKTICPGKWLSDYIESMWGEVNYG